MEKFQKKRKACKLINRHNNSTLLEILHGVHPTKLLFTREMVSQVSTSSDWSIGNICRQGPSKVAQCEEGPKKRKEQDAAAAAALARPLKCPFWGMATATREIRHPKFHGRWMWPATRTWPRRQIHYLCFRQLSISSVSDWGFFGAVVRFSIN